MMWWMVVMMMCAVARAALAGYVPSCPPAAGDACRLHSSPSDLAHFYVLNEKITFIHGEQDTTLVIECSSQSDLESEAMPRYEERLWVERVKLKGCRAPRSGYAAVLRALHVRYPDSLTLDGLPSSTRLSATLFQNLTNLVTVRIIASEHCQPDDDFLTLLNVKNTELSGLSLSSEALLGLPQTIESLELENLGDTDTADNILEKSLKRLPKLSSLRVNDLKITNLSLSDVSNLRIIDIVAPVTTPMSFKNIRKAHLKAVKWSAVENITCNAMEHLKLWRVRIERLGADWLSECPGLEVLEVRECGVTVLEDGLFANQPALRVLRLNGNQLTKLTGNLFQKLSNLEELELSNNKLTQVSALTSLRNLRTLTLDYNKELSRELCPGTEKFVINDISLLHELKELRSISLEYTGANYFCRDLSDLPKLENINYNGNNITELSYEDLLFRGGPRTVNIEIQYNKLLKKIYYSETEYQLDIDWEKKDLAKVILLSDAELACDCWLYYFVKASRSKTGRVQLKNYNVQAKCLNSGTALSEVELDELVCPVLPSQCARNCTCILDPQVGGVSATCTAVHEIPSIVGLTKLRLENSVIATLSKENLTANLRMLNISNSQLTRMDPETAALLVAGGRTLWLAGNPLRCACADQALVRALHDYSKQIIDYDEVACMDGKLVRDLTPEHLCPRHELLALLALLAIPIAVVILIAMRGPSIVKKMFHNEPDRPRDVFLSYAHVDVNLAIGQILKKLEAPPNPYITWLHFRDWKAGAVIAENIRQSVTDSKCTLVLLSQNYLKSKWALAEFREARTQSMRDHRRCLVVVLLDDVRAQPDLPRDVQHYLNTNTYIVWNEPRFWQKLRDALPKPRGLRAPDKVTPAAGA